LTSVPMDLRIEQVIPELSLLLIRFTVHILVRSKDLCSGTQLAAY
jgi:hypothetical protein